MKWSRTAVQYTAKPSYDVTLTITIETPAFHTEYRYKGTLRVKPIRGEVVDHTRYCNSYSALQNELETLARLL